MSLVRPSKGGGATRFPRSGRVAGISAEPHQRRENVNLCACGTAACGVTASLATKQESSSRKADYLYDGWWRLTGFGED